MTTTSKPLVTAAYAANAETTVYTAPAGTRTIIDKCTATNTGAALTTIAIKLVPSGGTAGAGNLVGYTKTLAVGDIYTFPEIVGHVLEAGGFISALPGAANSIVLRISGREVT